VQDVTAAFNLNILSHLNRQFQGNFNLEQFKHWAFYNPIEHRIEMHLQSLISQTVILKNLDYKASFKPEETIRTEISRKFHLPTLMTVLEGKAIAPIKIWTDPNAWFALVLCQRQCINQDCP
jgi:L-histidine Nalpha-methyltransferase